MSEANEQTTTTGTKQGSDSTPITSDFDPLIGLEGSPQEQASEPTEVTEQSTAPVDEVTKPKAKDRAKERLERAERKKAELAEKKQLAEATKELEELRAWKQAQEKKDKYELVGGPEGFEQLAKDLAEKKIKPKTIVDEKFSTIEQEIAKLRAEQETIRKEREEYSKKLQLESDKRTIGEHLTTNAEKYPWALIADQTDQEDGGWAKREALELAYQYIEQTGKQPDLDEIFELLNSRVEAQVRPLFNNDAFLDMVLADADVKERLSARLLGKKSAPQTKQPGRLSAPITASDKAVSTRKEVTAETPRGPVEPWGDLEDWVRSQVRSQNS
jgi:hypothetical protein